MIYIQDANQLYELNFDIMLSESHDWSSDITTHTVETGLAVTDHIRLKPKTVKFELFLSNEPLYHVDMVQRNVELTSAKNARYPKIGNALTRFAGQALDLGNIFDSPQEWSVRVDTFDFPIDPIGLTLDTLERLRDEQALLVIVTPKRVYSDFVLESLSMSRSKEDGTGCRLSLSFHEIRIVSTRTVAAPRAPIQQKPKVQKGAQAAKAVEPKASVVSQQTGLGVAGPAVNGITP